jgi:hypothetical protein
MGQNQNKPIEYRPPEQQQPDKKEKKTAELLWLVTIDYPIESGRKKNLTGTWKVRDRKAYRMTEYQLRRTLAIYNNHSSQIEIACSPITRHQYNLSFSYLPEEVDERDIPIPDSKEEEEEVNEPTPSNIHRRRSPNNNNNTYYD